MYFYEQFYKTTVKFFLITMLLGIGVRLAAQDLLVFTDGSIEQVKVLEIGDDAIKYKKWTNLDGPTFSTSRANILNIKYQDGTEEKMINRPYQPARQNTGGGGYPQTRDGGFSIHFGGAFPVGNFGEEPNYYDYYDYDYDVEDFLYNGRFSASPGFSVGVKGKIPLQVNGLGIFISGDFIFNGLKGDIKETFDEAENDYDEIKRPRYINIPIFVGLNYK